ncbi:hypothetical protein FA95DRAFT_1565544 [Auriscalpium vulgare]|uniref:Uncharacterized protein n=1 Tax=Auriscalpium vulgare TaxID=40419 RepID=A0ACB8RB44_9AGAM|nr:hypothetical protein FA95DRAFT_1565544 [Auriscalpium vulgare]
MTHCHDSQTSAHTGRTRNTYNPARNKVTQSTVDRVSKSSLILIQVYPNTLAGGLSLAAAWGTFF